MLWRAAIVCDRRWRSADISASPGTEKRQRFRIAAPRRERRKRVRKLPRVPLHLFAKRPKARSGFVAPRRLNAGLQKLDGALLSQDCGAASSAWASARQQRTQEGRSQQAARLPRQGERRSAHHPRPEMARRDRPRRPMTHPKPISLQRDLRRSDRLRGAEDGRGSAGGQTPASARQSGHPTASRPT